MTLIETQGEPEREVQFIPYQLCPKCNGQGRVSMPPGIPGDVYQWSSTGMSFECDVCEGAKIIPQYIIPKIKFNP